MEDHSNTHSHHRNGLRHNRSDSNGFNSMLNFITGNHPFPHREGRQMNVGPNFARRYEHIRPDTSMSSDEEEHEMHMNNPFSRPNIQITRSNGNSRVIIINRGDGRMDLGGLLLNILGGLNIRPDAKQPASRDTIENLKEIEIDEDDYELNNKTNEKQPPNCAI